MWADAPLPTATASVPCSITAATGFTLPTATRSACWPTDWVTLTQGDTRGVRPICVDGRWVDEPEREHINAMIFGMFDEIEAAAAREHDVAASEVIDFTGRFGPLRRHWIELLECRAPEEVSVLDAGRYCDTRLNYAVKDGYGRLIEKLSCGLAVRCDSPVTEIETTSNSVRVRGNFGEIECAAVILTASLGVLAAGAITLHPEPDQAFAAALDDVRLGTYEKTIVAFDRPVLAFPPDTQSFYCDIVDPSETDDLPLNFEIQPFGRPLAISHLAGGSLDRLFASAGERGLIDLTISKLVRAFGADIRRHIVGTVVTSWGRNPFIRGGYAIARPGRAKSRERLIAGDISDRVFLAGEACHPYWYATAHGAYLTGIDRAHRALELDRLAGHAARSALAAASRGCRRRLSHINVASAIHGLVGASYLYDARVSLWLGAGEPRLR